MANINEYGFPFSSVSNDRQYSAVEWREYFGTLIKDGIVQNALNECKVKAQVVPNKSVLIDSGTVFIKGAMRILGVAQSVSIDDNSSGNPRIDRIVARLNLIDRKIEFAVLKGTPTLSPVAVSLTRDASVWELALADITLANGFSTITGTAIIDQRSDADLCGASSMTIGVIPPSGSEAATVSVSGEVQAKYNLPAEHKNVDAALLGALLPVSAVVPFAAPTVPEGFLKCNGAAVSRGAYAALFSAIGTTYGVGDGSTTFNLPDLRGEFLRGWDDGRGIDSGRNLGSGQSATSVAQNSYNALSRVQEGENPVSSPANVFGATSTESGIRYEFKPRNIALMYCIKY